MDRLDYSTIEEALKVKTNIHGVKVNQGTYSVYQIHTDESGKKYPKRLFEGLPAKLVLDFFKNNKLIYLHDNRGREGKDEIVLEAEGFDKAKWTYIILDESLMSC
jgi:hypothetical protein